jgi:hypothetical protein
MSNTEQESSASDNGNDEIAGVRECMELAFAWFIERGQFMFMELPIPEQLLFAKAAHLDAAGLMKALQFLAQYCEARRNAALNYHGSGGRA